MAKSFAWKDRAFGHWLLPVMLLVMLAIFNISIVQKENLRRNGALILLELAPVDPRSLMQGDYMRLDYQVIADARRAIETAKDLSAASSLDFIILNIDDKRRGSFSRFKKDAPLAADEKLLAIQHTYGAERHEIGLTPTSFFFQEGQGAYFCASKIWYGPSK